MPQGILNAQAGHLLSIARPAASASHGSSLQPAWGRHGRGMYRSVLAALPAVGGASRSGHPGHAVGCTAGAAAPGGFICALAELQSLRRKQRPARFTRAPAGALCSHPRAALWCRRCCCVAWQELTRSRSPVRQSPTGRGELEPPLAVLGAFRCVQCNAATQASQVAKVPCKAWRALRRRAIS